MSPRAGLRLALLVPLSVVTPAAAEETLLGCRRIGAADERLACYDRVVDAVREEMAPEAPPPEPQASSAPPTRAESPEDRTVSERLFGRSESEGAPSLRKTYGLDTPHEISASVSAAERGGDRLLLITLDTDSDSDGVGDVCDNCPSVSNPGQENFDGDREGDACDFDDDNDGHGDLVDNCPFFPHWDRTDSDSDAVGDVCDNCDGQSNPDQRDSDGDRIGDACDNCASTPNATQENADGDGAGDACDNCPDAFSYDLADADGDGRGNACDACPFDPLDDADGDGFCADVDNCPDVPNPDQADTDHGPFDGQWASTASASSQYGEVDWSASQATGWPDVVGCLDSARAWAPLGSGAEETENQNGNNAI